MAMAPHSGAAATSSALGDEAALRLRGVSKTFPGVQALVDVDLEVRPGTVHALLGHNGSGKSTLIKCLAGVQDPDSGAEASVFGRPLDLGDGDSAAQAGLRFVHQDLGVFPELSIADNIALGTGYTRGGLRLIDWRRQMARAEELLARFGVALDPSRPLAEASPPQRAVIAIVRAVAGWPGAQGVLVLDEPTAALPAHEVDMLFELIRDISGRGAAVVLVSHRLDEVMAIADEATVLREGAKVWSGPLAGVSLPALVDLVVGTSAEAVAELAPHRAPAQGGAPVLDVRGLRAEYLRGVDLTVRPGEIVGVAGLLGSGREEVPYVLAGAQTSGVSGSFSIDGKVVDRFSVRAARARGIALVPADRGTEAIIGGFLTTENVSLGALSGITRFGIFAPSAERSLARRWMRSVHADEAYAPRPITTLSGGNQQKVVLARELSVAPRVLVVSEPTAGIDIGARNVIYQELRRRADKGLAVVMASSDMEDLLACCDRVIALRDGRIAGEFSGDRLTKSALAYAIEGAHE
jgi:ribose transport system ATP-binding protein